MDELHASFAEFFQMICLYVPHPSQSLAALRPSIVQKIEPPGWFGHDVCQGTTFQFICVQ